MLFVAPADNLKKQVGVAIVVGQISELIDAEQSEPAIMAQAAVKRARGLSAAQVQKQLGGGDKQGRMTG